MAGTVMETRLWNNYKVTHILITSQIEQRMIVQTGKLECQTDRYTSKIVKLKFKENLDILNK